VKNRELGNPDTVVIHVGTNDLGRSVILDYVMGYAYALLNTAKIKFLKFKLVLSSVFKCRDVSWRRIGALNDKIRMSSEGTAN
jgi:hypothetical protein